MVATVAAARRRDRGFVSRHLGVALELGCRGGADSSGCGLTCSQWLRRHLPIGEIEVRVSPNGHHLAFIARHAGMTSLWVRSFDVAAPWEVAVLTAPRSPFGPQTVDRLDSSRRVP